MFQCMGTDGNLKDIVFLKSEKINQEILYIRAIWA